MTPELSQPQNSAQTLSAGEHVRVNDQRTLFLSSPSEFCYAAIMKSFSCNVAVLMNGELKSPGSSPFRRHGQYTTSLLV